MPYFLFHINVYTELPENKAWNYLATNHEKAHNIKKFCDTSFEKH